MLLVQFDIESREPFWSKDFNLAPPFNILKYSVLVCCLSAQKVFINFIALLQILNESKSGPCTGSFFSLLLLGFIKNTEKLSYGKERMYKLTVTAYDCGKNRASEDVLVKISVKPTCKPSWQGIKALLYSL